VTLNEEKNRPIYMYFGDIIGLSIGAAVINCMDYSVGIIGLYGNKDSY
jgi:hypothetical protein